MTTGPTAQEDTVVGENSTVLEVLNRAGVDLREFAIRQADVNARGETWQVKVSVRPRTPPGLGEGVQSLLDKISKLSPKPSKRAYKAPGDLLGCVYLFDWHAGKLSWAEETGHNWDLRIAEKTYNTAVDDLLCRSRASNVGSFLYVVGNDAINADNTAGTTARGTPVDCTDDRLSKVFSTAAACHIRAISLMVEQGPVRVVLVQGNHDPTVSYYLVQVLAAYFRNDPNVTFDQSPRTHKYHRHGTCLFGLTHGNNEKMADLPLRMAAERPEDWAACNTREWHLGHFHKVTCEEYKGVRVRVMPSLCPPDAWHFSSGYVGNVRAAEMWIYSATHGYYGHHSVPARS